MTKKRKRRSPEQIVKALQEGESIAGNIARTIWISVNHRGAILGFHQFVWL
ncbi:hypothetical protein HOV93_32790 [Planctomycetes bacterium FF15]|uniref:Uncharacterized protein n=1 Tax=Bremerella alba TaxID=980252 RepID=A0A7V9A846_9BACT|nr:hypothetical protein [Bremerella alba]